MENNRSISAKNRWKKLRENKEELEKLLQNRSKGIKQGWKNMSTEKYNEWKENLTNSRHNKSDKEMLKINNKISKSNKIYHNNMSDDEKKIRSNNIRKGNIKYIENCIKNNVPINVCVGKNETKILNELENIFNTKFIRQYPILGYFLDGYSPELNLAVEVDEMYHYTWKNKLKTKDIIRQNRIKGKLKCEFLRIKDFNDKNWKTSKTMKENNLKINNILNNLNYRRTK